VPLHERAAGVARPRPAAGGGVLWPPVPTAGALAPRAGEVLPASKEPHGVAPPVAFCPAPVLVNRRLLQQPERREARGLGLGRARRRGRLVESTRRVHVETTGHLVLGWAKQATQTPTACRLMPQWAAVRGLKGGGQRQRAPPWAAVPQADLTALGVPRTSLPLPPRG
jgi:hypothetical protein